MSFWQKIILVFISCVITYKQIDLLVFKENSWSNKTIETDKVNGAITDAVTQANIKVLADSLALLLTHLLY
ncbi:MAG: hypothetical protein F6K40_31155 [Okeania sp. SIO3I5]|uniref:RebB family R body protein n=1 Tax=Okeania sp. SIO3I5 TaxID=2607805 RepID=UPI0013BD9D92|nr:RebB family R body protein [Okeania sp. SIO3I5]NEQ40449.1 hypothetical protein [Okeania sp. SIO3I5]